MANILLLFGIFSAVLLSLCECYKPNQVVSAISVPVGALLPEGNLEANAVVMFAVKRHNARLANFTASIGVQNTPNLMFKVYLQTTRINDSFSLIQESCTHLSHRTRAIIGYWDLSTAHSMRSYSKNFRMPFITPSLPFTSSSDDSFSYTISLYPRLEMFFFKLIQELDWDDFTYIFDTNEVHLHLKNLLQFSIDVRKKVKIRNLEGNQNYFPLLKEVACNEEHHIIIDLPLKKSLEMLKKINTIGMLTREHHYVFTDLTLLHQNLSMYKHGVKNLTFISVFDRYSEEYGKFLSDVSTTYSISSFNDSESLFLYDAFTAMALGIRNVKEVVFGEEIQKRKDVQSLTCHGKQSIILSSGYQIIQAIKNVRFKGLSGNVQFNEKGERSNYSINIYSFKSNGSVVKVGQWSDDSSEQHGCLFLNDNVKHKQRFLTENITFVVTSIIEEPYLMLKNASQYLTGNDRYEGFCVDLLREIAEMMPFYYKIKLVEDGEYGSKNLTTGMWNGMIGEVMYQQADMAMAPLTITSMREAVVDFTKPFMSLGISIMIKRPINKSTDDIFSFLHPLSLEIWIFVALAYVLVSVCWFLISRISPYEWHKHGLIKNEKVELVDSNLDFSLKNTLWFSFGSFVQQGCELSPISLSGRILVGSWFFFNLIIMASYTANLTAFLTIDRIDYPIKSAEDLVQQSEYNYGTMQSGSTADFFRLSPIPTYQEMWKFMKSESSTSFVKSNQEGIKRVRSKEKYAFLIESSLNEYTAERRPCNTLKIGPNLDSKGYGIALSKGSPYYDSINLAILQLREKGKLQKIKNYWWYHKSECGEGDNTNPIKALGLANVFGVFILLAIGIILAVGCACIGKIYKTMKASNKMSKKNKSELKKETYLAQETQELSEINTTASLPLGETLV